jgi:hypothetical protein
MPSKYTPLENYLHNLPEKQKEIMLGFEEIEKIINSKLPSSANEQSWWEHETEGNHINKRAWANAGWKVSQVNFKEKRVKLVRE